MKDEVGGRFLSTRGAVYSFALILALCLTSRGGGGVEATYVCPGTVEMGAALPDTTTRVVAQAFSVSAPVILTSFSAQLVDTLGDGVLTSAQVWTDTRGGAPAVALADGAFSVVNASFTAGNVTPMTFSSNDTAGIALSAGKYWLVLTLSTTVSWTYGSVPAVNPYANDTVYVIPGSFFVYSSGWVSLGDASTVAYLSFSGCLVPPSPSPSPTPSLTPTPSISASPTPSPTPTPSASSSPSASASVSPSMTPTVSPTVSPSISATPSASATPSLSVTPTISVTPSTSPSSSVSPTPSISITPSNSPSSSASPSPSSSVSTSPSSSMSATPSISITPSISVTPSISITPSISPTPSASASPSPSYGSSPSSSPSPSVSPTISASPSVSATPSVSASVSPSAHGDTNSTVVLVANYTFIPDPTKPSIDLGASSNKTTTSVSADFSGLKIGNESATVGVYTVNEVVQVQPDNSEVTAYVYAASVGNAVGLAQAYAFFDHASSGDFAGIGFKIDQNALKWTVNLTANSSVTGGQQLGPIDLRYTLAAKTDSPLPLQYDMMRKPRTPLANMTTYLLPITSFIMNQTMAADGSTKATIETVFIQVEVFDVALADGDWQPTVHSATRISSPSSRRPSYSLELILPSFREELHYDPSLGLSTLLGTSESGSGSGGSGSGLIIAVAVAIPVAVLIVLGVIVAIVGVAWWRRRQKRRQSAKRKSMINFHDL